MKRKKVEHPLARIFDDYNAIRTALRQVGNCATACGHCRAIAVIALLGFDPEHTPAPSSSGLGKRAGKAIKVR